MKIDISHFSSPVATLRCFYFQVKTCERRNKACDRKSKLSNEFRRNLSFCQSQMQEIHLYFLFVLASLTAIIFSTPVGLYLVVSGFFFENLSRESINWRFYLLFSRDLLFFHLAKNTITTPVFLQKGKKHPQYF